VTPSRSPVSYPGSIRQLASADVPTVVDVLNSQNVIIPGLQNKQISGRLDPGSTAVPSVFSRRHRLWILPADVPDADSPTQRPSMPVYPFLLRCQNLLRSHRPRTQPSQSIGPATPCGFGREPSLPPTGNWWFHCGGIRGPISKSACRSTPTGSEIWAGNINSLDRYSDVCQRPMAGAMSEAGILDFDSNAGCVIDGRCNENVVWSVAAPAGDNVARVDTFSLCGNSAARLDCGGVV